MSIDNHLGQFHKRYLIHYSLNSQLENNFSKILFEYPRSQWFNRAIDNILSTNIGFEISLDLEKDKIDGLVQERRNSSALEMELRLSCTNPSRCLTDAETACWLKEIRALLLVQGGRLFNPMGRWKFNECTPLNSAWNYLNTCTPLMKLGEKLVCLWIAR